MSEIIGYREVEEKVLSVRGQNVLLDRDVAELYGVETKRVNETVSNNPDKFPEEYAIALDSQEWSSLRSKVSTLNNLGRGQHYKVSGNEATIEINFAIMKIKHTVKRSNANEK